MNPVGHAVIRPVGHDSGGSPALLAAYGQPEALTDIARIPTLTTGSSGGSSVACLEQCESRPIELVHDPPSDANDFYTVRRAAL